MGVDIERTLRFRRLALAVLGSFTLAVASAASVLAQWPTSCVEANDAFEQYVGNTHNVGIYQRTFGDAIAAEQACRNDHGDDIRAAFGWALQGTSTTPPSATTPAPATTPRGGLPTAPQGFEVDVRSDVFIVRILTPADGGGLNLEGYHWTLSGPESSSGTADFWGGNAEITFSRLRFPEGDYVFTASAFNARGDGQSASTSFTVEAQGYWDPTLRQAYDLAVSALGVSEGLQDLLTHPELQSLTVEFANFLGTGFAGFSPSAWRIRLRPDLRNERLPALAATLAHELVHAYNADNNRNQGSGEACVIDELEATGLSVIVWSELGAPSPQTSLERNIHHAYVIFARDGLEGLESYIRELYGESCAV